MSPSARAQECALVVSHIHILLLKDLLYDEILTIESLENLALTEAAYTVVRMLQTCKTLETRDFEPFQEKYMVSLYSATGTQVALTV